MDKINTEVLRGCCEEDPNGGLEVVRTAHRQVVTGVAGDDAGHRQTRFEPQLLAQLHLGRVGDLGRLDRLDRLLPYGGGPSGAGNGKRNCDSDCFHLGVVSENGK